MKRKSVEKDPFAEYDKFWDKLDEAEEIKADEDYFKDRLSNQNQRSNQFSKNQVHKMIKNFAGSSIFFVIFGFMMVFLFTDNYTISGVIFSLFTFVFFGIFAVAVITMLSKLKNK